MSLLSTLFSVSTSQPVQAVGKIIDQLYTSEDEKLEKQVLLTRLALAPQLAQIEVQKVEAQSRSVFVAGARPFILWVCGVGLAMVFIVNPVIQWTTGKDGPAMQTEALMSLVTSLLGLGALRTVEKLTGKAK